MTGEPHSGADSVALREVLRRMRFAMRRIRAAVARTTKASRHSRALLEGPFIVLDEIAMDVESTLSRVARERLGGSPPHEPTLRKLAASGAAKEFGKSYYYAVTTLLRLEGEPGVFVSELLAARELHQILAQEPAPSFADIPAKLTIALARKHIVSTAEHSESEVGNVIALALFAAMLWLLADRNVGLDEDALTSAMDIARGLESEIVAAVAAENEAAIGRLYVDFAPHV
jgi:hypothetical protein